MVKHASIHKVQVWIIFYKSNLALSIRWIALTDIDNILHNFLIRARAFRVVVFLITVAKNYSVYWKIMRYTVLSIFKKRTLSILSECFDVPKRFTRLFILSIYSILKYILIKKPIWISKKMCPYAEQVDHRVKSLLQFRTEPQSYNCLLYQIWWISNLWLFMTN